MIPKSDLRGGASWGTFVGPNHFGTFKVAPSTPKVLPMIEKKQKHDTEERPDYETEFQKFFRKSVKKRHLKRSRQNMLKCVENDAEGLEYTSEKHQRWLLMCKHFKLVN